MSKGDLFRVLSERADSMLNENSQDGPTKEQSAPKELMGEPVKTVNERAVSRLNDTFRNTQQTGSQKVGLITYLDA